MWLVLSEGRSPYRRAALSACAAVAASVSVAAAIAAWRRMSKLGRRKRYGRGRLVSDDQGKDGGFSWKEVSRRQSVDCIWIVLHDQVYDVTPFYEEHPGGKLLLLAYAGTDATDAWETVGHSSLAKRTLEGLHIGHVQKGPRPIEEPGPIKPALKTKRTAEITGGRDSPCKLRNKGPLWSVQDYGFLPLRDPVGIEALYGTPFEAFANLTELIPSLAVTGAFRKHLHSDTKLQARLSRCNADAVELLEEDQCERAFSVVGFCICAYWRGCIHKYGNGLLNDVNVPMCLEGAGMEVIDTIPSFLSIPMLALSTRLSRPPMVDYAATVLYNWERIDPSGPIVVHNIRCPVRLSGMSDEEWFFKTHVVIESEAAPAVSAISRMMQTKDDAALLEELLVLEDALWRVVRACMPLMYERADDGVSRCNEHVFYHIIRPFISTGSILFEGEEKPRFLHGPSGAMSSLLPAVDAALGIEVSSQKLKDALILFGRSMPLEHQEFLTKIRSCQDIRSRLQYSRPVAGVVDEHHEALVRAYNRCISRILDFRWQHWQYVKNFIMKPANLNFVTGTGGTSFDYLQKHITDTEQARLAERNADGNTYPGTPNENEEFLHLPSLLVTQQPSRQPLGVWSVDGPHGLLSSEPMLGLEDWDLWRASMPPQLHDAIRKLLDLVGRMPALCLTEGRFYARCEEGREQLAAFRQESLIVGLSEINRERLLTLLSHIAAGCKGNTTHKRAPKCIERPLQVASRLAGRSPNSIDLPSLVLANWTAEKCPTEDSALSELEGASRMRVVCCFIASPDEEWYRAVHLVLHEQARDVVTQIRAGQDAARNQDDVGIVRCMGSLETWMNKFSDYFDAHFEQKDSRTEDVMMRRLSKVAWKNDCGLEETACWVYCSGSSVLMPMIHAFLGIPFCKISASCDSPDAERICKILESWVEEMKMYMPAPHRAFLEELQAPGVSLRQYCIKRFGAKVITVELLHGIEVAYNEALNALIRFMSRRMHLVHRFLPHLSSVFGGMHSHIEAGVRKNRLQLLKMRQRVDACLETS